MDLDQDGVVTLDEFLTFCREDFKMIQSLDALKTINLLMWADQEADLIFLTQIILLPQLVIVVQKNSQCFWISTLQQF